jgi:hypothetical protein
MSKNAVNFNPIGVTFETIDSLTKMQEMNALALYMAYTAVSHWQKTYKPKASDSFMQKRVGWGEEKFTKAKRILLGLGLIENVKVIDPISRKIKDWYIKINHLINEGEEKTTPLENQGGGKATGVENQPPSTLNYKLSTLNSSEVLPSPFPEDSKTEAKADLREANLEESKEEKIHKTLEYCKKNKIRIIKGDNYAPTYKKPKLKKALNSEATQWMTDLIKWYCQKFGLSIPTNMEKQFIPIKKIEEVCRQEGIKDRETVIQTIKDKWEIYYPTTKWMGTEPDFFNLQAEWHKIKIKTHVF